MMKKKKITKRLVYLLILGMLAYVIIEFARDPKSHIQAFKEGFHSGYTDSTNK